MFRGGWATPATTSVDASPSSLWKSIIDIEAAKTIIPAVQSVELLSGDKTMQVGAKWKEVRRYKGKDHTLIKTVTSLTENDPYYDVHILVDFGKSSDFTNTATLSVRPAVESDDKENNPTKHKKSLLVGTFAIQVTGWFGRLQLLLLGCCVRSESATGFQGELESYKTAAGFLERQQSN